MIGRRGVMAAALLGGAALAGGSAQACRAPGRKDRAGYRRAIEALFAAWWTRDEAAFRKWFDAGDGQAPFDATPLFHQRFTKPSAPYLGEVMFTGNVAMVQAVEVMGPDYEHGMCGGYGAADLYMVRFFPGLDRPVIQELALTAYALLAQDELPPRQ